MSARLSNRTKFLVTLLCGSILAFGGLATSTIEASAQTSDASNKACSSAFRTNKTKIETAVKARGGEARIKQIMTGAGCKDTKVSITRSGGGPGNDPNKVKFGCHTTRNPFMIHCDLNPFS